METKIGTRFKNAVNAFLNNRDPTTHWSAGYGHTYRPDRPRVSGRNERSIVTAIFNRIALDVAALKIVHCKVDEDGNYTDTINSTINNCLNLEANLDQSGRAFIQDVVMSMLDEGSVAIVPIDTDTELNDNGSYSIYTMRTGKIVEWLPGQVKVEVYNDRTGKKETLLMSKTSVAIIENPLFAVINEPNSTMQRLVRKLSLLDSIDEQSGSGKLDLIIQLPYIIKSDARREQAEKRRKDIEMQLAGSKYGIAYTDGTERITQLNRPVENNLMKQIEYLTSMLYSQLGITQSVLDGTADEKTMLNYHTRSIEPIVSAIVDEMKRKFLSKTARSKGQSILFFRDVFKLVTAADFAEISSNMLTSELMTRNEFRPKLGLKPSDDPKANQLINSNINQTNTTPAQQNAETEIENTEEGEIQNGG